MEKRISAFTLLELILVLAVLAIILGIAIPFFSRSITDYDISNQIDKLYADINYAKFYCISHQMPINIQISQNNIKALTNQTTPVLIVQDNFTYPVSCTPLSSTIAINAFGIAQSNVSCYVTQKNNANPNCFTIDYLKVDTGRWQNGTCKQ